MSNQTIDFSSDWDQGNLERHLREIAHGRLPGKWGLVQNLVSHWAIPKDQRGVLRYGQAALDSMGSVLGYRESQRREVDGGTCPTRTWLRENNYEPAFPASAPGFGGFVRSSLAAGEFREKRIRNELGGLDRVVLHEFSLGEGRSAFFLDAFPDGKSPGKASNWFGPYCRKADRNSLSALVAAAVWERLDTRTIMLETTEQHSMHGCEAIRLSQVPDTFDFASACDTFNDVIALAERCQSFLAGGRSRTLLFHGPPGTGKSTLARAIARQLDVRVVLISQEAVVSLADATTLEILALLEPGVVVLNDVDRSGGHAHQALLQGLERSVPHALLTILTVNDLNQLDPALLRPGRTHEVREIPEPSKESRDVIMRYYQRKHDLSLTAEDTETFLERSDGFSPADVKEFCETVKAIGVPKALDELTRIAAQRELYSGDRCQEFNQDRPRPRPRRRYGHLRF